jgi:hypothetical protein
MQTSFRHSPAGSPIESMKVPLDPQPQPAPLHAACLLHPRFRCWFPRAQVWAPSASSRLPRFLELGASGVLLAATVSVLLAATVHRLVFANGASPSSQHDSRPGALHLVAADVGERCGGLLGHLAPFAEAEAEESSGPWVLPLGLQEAAGRGDSPVPNCRPGLQEAAKSRWLREEELAPGRGGCQVALAPGAAKDLDGTVPGRKSQHDSRPGALHRVAAAAAAPRANGWSKRTVAAQPGSEPPFRANAVSERGVPLRKISGE